MVRWPAFGFKNVHRYEAIFPNMQVSIKITVMFGVLFTANFPAHSSLVGDTNDVTNNAKNLARMNCGTHVTLITAEVTRGVRPTGARSDSVTNLLLDDNTLSCHLARGDNTFLIALHEISTLDRF